MREDLFPSTIDECEACMGKHSAAFEISGMDEEDIEKLKAKIRSAAGKNGYPDRILKRDESRLYMF